MRKEVLHIIRHPRSYWLYLAAFGIPFLLFALLLSWTNYIIQLQTEADAEDSYVVAWIGPASQANELKTQLDRDLRIKLVEGYKLADLPKLLEKDSLSLAVLLENDFDSAVAQQRQTKIGLHVHDMNSEALALVEDRIYSYRDKIRAKNLDSLNIAEGVLNPIVVQNRNYYSMIEMMDDYFQQSKRSIAGLLGLLFLIFGIIGAQYGLKRSFWMDKNSGTWFAILATGKARRVIFLRRFVLAGLYSWLLMLLAASGFLLALSMQQDGLFQKVLDRVIAVLSLGVAGNLLVMSLPLAFLLTALWGILGFYTKKSGYVVFNSLIFILLLLLFIVRGWDGQDLTISTALLPFFSTIYVLVELLKEEPHWGLLGLAFASGLGYASLLAFLSYWRFKSERFVTVV